MIMWREFLHAWKGRSIWYSLKRKYDIDYDKIVIILPEKDSELNMCAIKYVPYFMARKNVCEVIICTFSENIIDTSCLENMTVRIHIMSSEEMELLFCYYRMYKFFDNIVFLYLEGSMDKTNYLNALKRWNITLDELICLCFYKLRRVPEHV